MKPLRNCLLLSLAALTVACGRTPGDRYGGREVQWLRAGSRSKAEPGMPGFIWFASDGNLLRVGPTGLSLNGFSRWVHGRAARPSPSHDGLRVAFELRDSAAADTCPDLALLNWDGSGFRWLTRTESLAEREPAFSADDQWVFFIRMSEPGDSAVLYALGLTDGAERRIVALGGPEAGHVVVSPDGARLAFQAGRPSRIYFLDLTDGSRAEFGSGPSAEGAPEREPSFRPGGQRLAFCRGDSVESQIFTAAADGSGLSRVTEPGGCCEPSFSPDGGRIAYRVEGQGIWVANADGTRPLQIVSDPSARGPFWGSSPSEAR